MKNIYIEPKLYFVAMQTEDILSTSYLEESVDNLNIIDIGNIMNLQ